MHSPTAVCSTTAAMPTPGELGGAEVADDRRVGEQEQRLGHQRQERRYGEPQDLAVVPVRHVFTLAPGNDQSGST